MSFYDKLKFNAAGLIPAIIQEQKTGRAVTVVWMNRASLERTIETGKHAFLELLAPEILDEGQESKASTRTVKDVAFDCDGDCLLIQVEQNGPACHEGYKSCFFRSIEKGKGETFKTTEACNC